jgi:hypothetical protein
MGVGVKKILIKAGCRQKSGIGRILLTDHPAGGHRFLPADTGFGNALVIALND